MGYGCLGEEEELRIQYGMKACNELPDYYIMDTYNKIRHIIGLPLASDIASFDSNQYCCEKPIPFKCQIPI